MDHRGNRKGDNRTLLNTSMAWTFCTSLGSQNMFWTEVKVKRFFYIEKRNISTCTLFVA